MQSGHNVAHLIDIELSGLCHCTSLSLYKRCGEGLAVTGHVKQIRLTGMLHSVVRLGTKCKLGSIRSLTLTCETVYGLIVVELLYQ